MMRYTEFAWDRWFNPCFWCAADLWTDTQDVKAICRACDHQLEQLRDERPPEPKYDRDGSQTTLYLFGGRDD